MIQISERVAIALAEAENVLATYLMIDLERVRKWPRSFKKVGDEGNNEFTLMCEFSLFRHRKDKSKVYVTLRHENIFKNIHAWGPVVALVVNEEIKTHWKPDGTKWVKSDK